MRRIILGLALLMTAAIAAVAVASGGTITKTVVGAGSIDRSYAIAVQRPADVVVAKAIVPPGASFGWHYHRADVVAIVQSGTLSLYDSADPTCTAKRISAGHGFTEQRHHVHLARNEGSKDAVVLVAYLGLKHGVAPDVSVPSPGNCPF